MWYGGILGKVGCLGMEQRGIFKTAIWTKGKGRVTVRVGLPDEGAGQGCGEGAASWEIASSGSSKRYGAHRTQESLLLPAHLLLGYAPSWLTSLRLSSSSTCKCRLPMWGVCVLLSLGVEALWARS